MSSMSSSGGPGAASLSAHASAPASPAAPARPEPGKDASESRRCVVCGHLARSRCPYQSCKACCFRANNPCSLHNKSALGINKTSRLPGLKASFSGKETLISRNLPPFNQPNSHVSQPHYDKEQSRSTDHGGMSSPGFAKTDMARHHGYSPVVPSPPPQTPAFPLSPETIQLRLKSLRAVVEAYQKESLLVQAWRLNRMKEKEKNEIEIELECAERYTRNVSFLNEIFRIENQNTTAYMSSFQTFISQHPSCLNMDTRDLVENIDMDVYEAKVQISRVPENQLIQGDVKENSGRLFHPLSTDAERDEGKQATVMDVDDDRKDSELNPHPSSNHAAVKREQAEVSAHVEEEARDVDRRFATNEGDHKGEPMVSLKEHDSQIHQGFDFNALNQRIARHEELLPDDTLKLWNFLCGELKAVHQL